jgi:hypothetical protein
LLNGQEQGAATVKPAPIFGVPLPQQPALQLVYDTAPIGLAFLSPDCRYLQINQRLTEIAVSRLRIISDVRFETACPLWPTQSRESSIRS